MKSYEETNVVNSLNRKQDLKVNQVQKKIFETWGEKAKGDVGIKSKGKISFLTKFCGYNHIWVK